MRRRRNYDRSIATTQSRADESAQALDKKCVIRVELRNMSAVLLLSPMRGRRQRRTDHARNFRRAHFAVLSETAVIVTAGVDACHTGKAVLRARCQVSSEDCALHAS